MMQSTQIWKWHAVLLGIHTERLQYKDFGVLRIQKGLDESTGDYDGMATWKSNCSDKKKI